MAAAITYEKGLLKRSLKIEPPDIAAADFKRDTIIEKKVGNLGAKAAMLKQMTALTPLSWWEELIGDSAANVIELVKKTQWKEAVLTGMVDAAISQQNMDWMLSIIVAKWPTDVSRDIDAICAAFPETHKHQLLELMISAKEFKRLHHFYPNVYSDTPYWSAKTSHFVLKILQEAVRRNKSNWGLHETINNIGDMIHPDQFNQALRNWPVTHENWTYYAERTIQFFETINLRQNLYKELSK